MTKYLILLALTAPVLGWAGWHTYAGSLDQLATAPPGDADATDPKAQKSTAAAAAEARLLARAVVLFETTAPPLTDPDAKTAAQAVAGRAGELTDLQSFLAGRGEFVGPRSDKWKSQFKDQAETRDQEAKVLKLLAAIPADIPPNDARRQLAEIVPEVAAYRDTTWADRGKALNWEVTARSRVVAGQYAWAEGRYQEALARPAAEASAEWKDLKAALPELRAAVDATARLVLTTDLPVQEDATRALDDARRLRSDPWENREKLFSLPLDTPWRVPPDQLSGLLDDVTRVYIKLKPRDPGRAFIQRKVQGFCAAYAPPKLRLPPEVVFGSDGNKPRSQVTVTYDGGKRATLSDDPDEVNEHNFQVRLPRVTQVVCGGDPLAKDRLTATRPSVAAFRYRAARAAVADGAWTADAAEKLVAACDEFDAEAKKDFNHERSRDIMNALAEYTDRTDGAGPARVVARLVALTAAMRRQPDELFLPPTR